MKKLYRRGTVHPSPPTISDHLSFLPAAVLTLAAALSQEDREVLAYLISCSSNNFQGNRKATTQKKPSSASYGTKTTSSSSLAGFGSDHPPSFNCDCFECYMSYWARWDSSPKRQLIHEIIDAIEDDTTTSVPDKKTKSSKNKNKKDRKKRGSGKIKTESCELNDSEKSVATCKQELADQSEQHPTVEESSGECFDDGQNYDDDGVDKGSVRKFVSFIGDKIWGVWGQGK